MYKVYINEDVNKFYKNKVAAKITLINLIIIINIRGAQHIVTAYKNNKLISFKSRSFENLIDDYRLQTRGAFVPVIDIETAIENNDAILIHCPHNVYNLLVNCANHTYIQYRGARYVFHHSVINDINDLIAVPVNNIINCKNKYVRNISGKKNKIESAIIKTIKLSTKIKLNNLNLIN